VPHEEIAVHLGAAQIEVAVAQPVFSLASRSSSI
jgi:hypothetical protein